VRGNLRYWTAYRSRSSPVLSNQLNTVSWNCFSQNFYQKKVYLPVINFALVGDKAAKKSGDFSVGVLLQRKMLVSSCKENLFLVISAIKGYYSLLSF
jgi:hypothetical protein